MDNLKIIKTEENYDIALRELDRIMDLDPAADSDESNYLDILTLLIENYENKHCHIAMPDPVSAIKFRMEQQGLKNQDLVPYLGNKTCVSQVLNGKRDLTIKQARALHHCLGISAEVMLQEFPPELATELPLDWGKIPVMEMVNRGWIKFHGTAQSAKGYAEDLVRPFFDSFGLSKAFCRRGQGGEKDHYALMAFCAGVHFKIQQSGKKLNRTFDAAALTDEVVQGLVKLSVLPQGLQNIADYLGNYGIHFVTVKHFKKTHLDGAAMLLPDNTPVIALTLRYDRLDNFWFTLLHELAHIKMHLTPDNAEAFYDDLDASGDNCEIEQAANSFAMQALFPDWEKFGNQEWTAGKIKKTAFDYGISPAIIAGRIRKHEGNYRLFHQLIGRGEVRKNFPDYDR